MWDEMSTIIGWTNVSEFEDAKGGGVLKTNGHQVYVTDYGDNSYKGHHGAILKKYSRWPITRFHYVLIREVR